MIGIVYLAVLSGVLGCLALLDHRYRLVLWAHPWRALLVLAAGIAFFLLWDVLAIACGFYHRGDSPVMTGVMLGPELPLEELVFVTFLSYLTLVSHRLLGRALYGRRRGRDTGAGTCAGTPVYPGQEGR